MATDYDVGGVGSETADGNCYSDLTVRPNQLHQGFEAPALMGKDSTALTPFP